MTPEEILLGAIEVLEKNGHTTDGEFYDPETGGYCALGALAVSAGDKLCGTHLSSELTWESPSFMAAVTRLVDVIGVADYSDIPDWNDQLASKEDVILAMKKAAGR